jgi:hypothetical protein
VELRLRQVEAQTVAARLHERLNRQRWHESRTLGAYTCLLQAQTCNVSPATCSSSVSCIPVFRCVLGAQPHACWHAAG